MNENLASAKIIQKFNPHVQLVELIDGSKKIWKFPRPDSPYDNKIRELTHELVVGELFAYGGICNPVKLVFRDLFLCIEKDDYPYSWEILDSQPDIRIANADLFPSAFVIDWVTGQQDRWLESKENLRLKKLEEGSYLFAPTDNGHSLLMFNGQEKAENHIDSGYTSKLLFSTKINSREILERAIDEIRKWPIATIVEKAINKLLECGCTFSKEMLEFILQHKDKVINFINLRINIAKEKLLSWYDETHPQTTTPQPAEQAVAAP